MAISAEKKLKGHWNEEWDCPHSNNHISLQQVADKAVKTYKKRIPNFCWQTIQMVYFTQVLMVYCKDCRPCSGHWTTLLNFHQNLKILIAH